MIGSGDVLALAIGLEIAAAAATLVGYRHAPRATAWAAVALLAALFAGLVAQVPLVVAGGQRVEAFAWVPALGVSLTLRLDGLSLAFGLLITGIGALVVTYAIGYLGHGPRLARMLALLQAFSAAMLGLVLADDTVAMFVFWELTSIVSFFLIAFDPTSDALRRARQALVVTAAGGLALLVGVLLLSHAAREAGVAADMVRSMSALAGIDVRTASTYPAIVVLVAMGAFTKSAQVPFHFWLPGAMVAPTPVSAYLHSATMVQAGVYVLARLHPALGGTALWAGLLATVGGATLLVGACAAVRQRDLKLTLAHSTIAVLGALILLVGVGTTEAIGAFAVLLLAHAIYKAALFLVAGNVDHHCGHRDPFGVRGLARQMPGTATAAVVAACSMAGVPLLLGSVAKEGLYLAAATAPTPGVLGVALVALVAASGVLLVAASWIVGVAPFFGGGRRAPREDAPTAMWIGPLVLALAGLALGAATPLVAPLASAVASAVGDRPVEVPVAVWHGVEGAHGLVLALAAASLALGTGLFVWLRRRAATAASPSAPRTLRSERGYEAALAALQRAADRVASLLQGGGLQTHLAVAFACATGVAAAALAASPSPRFASPASSDRWYELALVVLAGAGAVTAAVTRDRLSAVAALGATGLAIAFLFALFSAPDLAITQLMVETLMVIVLVLVFRRLPPAIRRERRTGNRLLAVTTCAGFGAVMGGLLLIVAAQVSQPPIASEGHIAAAPGQHSANVVNAILVNFRALDTLGEVAVVAIAGVGVLALLRRNRASRA